MKPIRQTVLSAPNGNCFAACIASVLDLELDEVPNFCAFQRPRDWWRETQIWLAARGLAPVEFRVKDDAGNWFPRISPLYVNVLCILGGKSPRGSFDHAVVGETTDDGFRLLHDPHPEGKFLDGDPTHVLFLVNIGGKSA